jgi:hypothetical protein
MNYTDEKQRVSAILRNPRSPQPLLNAAALVLAEALIAHAKGIMQWHSVDPPKTGVYLCRYEVGPTRLFYAKYVTDRGWYIGAPTKERAAMSCNLFPRPILWVMP